MCLAKCLLLEAYDTKTIIFNASHREAWHRHRHRYTNTKTLTLIKIHLYTRAHIKTGASWCSLC